MKKKPESKTINRSHHRSPLFSALLITLIFLIIGGMSSDQETDIKTSTVAVVFGAGINGEEVSPRLKARLDACLETVKEMDIPIIVSGGQGADEMISEALAMKRYLVNHGIKASRIFREEQSTSTVENIQFSGELMGAQWPGEKQKVLLITSDFHMFRVRFLAQRANWEFVCQSAKHSLAEHIQLIPRELLAIIKDLVIVRKS